jgi:glutamyl-tRNA(Gln) amidotransferase subunit D (EC 6.3.5.7)
MSEYTGYNGNSLQFLKTNKILVGDYVKILADITYSGIVMPRYEHSDDKHIVLKLKSGYNIGLEIEKIEKIEKNPSIEKSIEKNQEIKKNEKFAKYFIIINWRYNCK